MNKTFYETYRCEFRADTHQYFLVNKETGEIVKELKSVTRLLAQHGLAPDYSMVDAGVLNAKAERGSLIHREIDEYVKFGEVGMTGEVQDFIRLCGENDIEPTCSEFVVYDENYAGTVDLSAWHEGDSVFADNKTSSVLHKVALAWQLSIYATIARKMGYTVDKLGGFHLTSNSKFVWVNEIPAEEVQKLFAADLAGEKYEQRALAMSPETLAQIIEFEEYIANLDAQKKAAQAQYDELKAALIAAMKENGVKSYDSDRVKVTYIEATTREGVDTKALKAEMPEVYSKYRKTTAIKENVKITVRGGNE